MKRFRADFSAFVTSFLRRMMAMLQLFGNTLDDLQAPALAGDGDIDLGSEVEPAETLWKEHVRIVAWKKGFLPLVTAR